MSGPPLWQRAVLGAQARTNPLLRAAVDREDVAAALAAAQAVRTGVARVAERPSRRLLHLVNLPAGSDINRLLVQLAQLEREVRELRKQVADTHGEPKGPYS